MADMPDEPTVPQAPVRPEEPAADLPDTEAEPATGSAPQPIDPRIRRSRLGGVWVMLTSGAVILVLLLIFILQNGQKVEVHVYGAHWDAPLGVALLMASAFGVLLVVVPGAGRIIQLRLAARRLHRRAATAPDSAQ